MKRLLCLAAVLLPVLCFGAVGNQFHGTFTGNGVGITNIMGTNVVGGTGVTNNQHLPGTPTADAIVLGTNYGFTVTADGTITSTGNHYYSNSLYEYYGPNDQNSYEGGAGAYGGVVLNLHRPTLTNECGISFYNDSEGGTTNYMFIGMDVANPDQTFFSFYDRVVGWDVLRMGMSNTMHGHWGFALGQVYPQYTINMLDPPTGGTNGDCITHSLRIAGNTNGILMTSLSTHADEITFLQGDNTLSRWINWDFGSGAQDWRLGTLGGSYDLHIYNKAGVAGHAASSPGVPVMTFSYSDLPSVIIPAGIQLVQGVQMAYSGAYASFTPATGWVGDGWVGQVFGVGTNDMLISKIGRMATTYGFTNTHKVMIINQADFTTNACVTLPRAREGMKWYYVACNTILTNGGTYALLTDSVTGDDPWATSQVPLSWDSNLTNRFPCTHAGSVPTNAVTYMSAGYTNYWWGLVNYVRE